MKIFYFFVTSFFSSLAVLNASSLAKSSCLEKEKALALLETAGNLLSKVEESFPSCKEDTNSTDQSECGGKKPLAYIEITKKLISDVREYFPTCPKVIAECDKPRDCSEILTSGLTENGVYTIWLREPYTAGKKLQVYCDMKTDNGSWTVIQRRGKFPVEQDFSQDWKSYKNGFGNITQEFWLGNENIRILCQSGCEIRFDLQDKEGIKAFAAYRDFNLTGNNYTIHISGYSGNAGDSMATQNNFDFSTKDKGNAEKARNYAGGWWYDNSYIFCNLNGKLTGIHWHSWRRFAILASVEIKVRPKKTGLAV